MGQNKLKDQVVGDSWENKLLYCLLLNEKDPKVYDMKVTRL